MPKAPHCLWLAAALAALGLGLSALAYSDDGAIEAVGGHIKPMKEHSSVAMTAEFVHAWVYPESVRVECVFFLANRGAATRVLVGFPCTSSGVDIEHATPFRRFRSWVDGEPVATHVVIDTASSSGDEWWRSWWVKEVEFGPDQVRCIRDEYAAEPGNEVPDWRSFEYELDTGATWLGPIGTADLVVTLVRMSTMKLELVSPAPTSRSEGELRWHFSNFEPSHGDSTGSIGFSWHPKDSKGFVGSR